MLLHAAAALCSISGCSRTFPPVWMISSDLFTTTFPRSTSRGHRKETALLLGYHRFSYSEKKKQQQQPKNSFCSNIEPRAPPPQCSSALLSAIEVTRSSTFLVRLDIRGAPRRGHSSAAFRGCCFDGLASDSEAAVFLLFLEPLKTRS